MRVCRIATVLICAFFGASNVSLVHADGNPKKPHQSIADLQQRMYAIGETSGRYSDFIDAEQNAVLEIRSYVAAGDPGALVEKNSAGDTPLMASALMGYSAVVGELLKSDRVRAAIEETNPKGMSAWIYANMAFRQAIWVCNPTVFKDPFSWVPLFVTQSYYVQSSENPYKKTRRLLEGAGAKASMNQAKAEWQETCKLQDENSRAKVQSSKDLLETVLAEGNEAQARFMAEQQAKQATRK